MTFKYKNKFRKKIKIIIEPIFDEFFLDRNETLIITTKGEMDIDINENYEEVVILTLDSHFHYERKIELINDI